MFSQAKAISDGIWSNNMIADHGSVTAIRKHALSKKDSCFISYLKGAQDKFNSKSFYLPKIPNLNSSFEKKTSVDENFLSSWTIVVYKAPRYWDYMCSHAEKN